MPPSPYPRFSGLNHKKLDVHSKQELCASLVKQDSESGDAPAGTGLGAKARKTKDGVSYVGVADFIVRSHGPSCTHKSHTMTPVEASVTVMVADSMLSERTFKAFFCEQCGKYFVTNTTYERLVRGGRLCCRVIEIDEVANPKKGKGVYANFADESLIHQYGYNVNKEEGLSSGSRRAILSFIIENGIMGQYEIIAFLEGLISTRKGMRNMQSAVAKWERDVKFLESYRPPKRSLKVGRMYVKSGRGKR